MLKEEYEELQDWLSNKIDNPPYSKHLSNYSSGYKEALLVVKSKIKEIYNRNRGD